MEAEEFATHLLGHPATLASCRLRYASLSPEIYVVERPNQPQTLDTIYRYRIGPNSRITIFVATGDKDYLLSVTIEDNLVPLLNGVKVGATRAEIEQRVKGLQSRGENLVASNADGTRRVSLRFTADTLRSVFLTGYMPNQ